MKEGDAGQTYESDHANQEWIASRYERSHEAQESQAVDAVLFDGDDRPGFFRNDLLPNDATSLCNVS